MRYSSRRSYAVKIKEPLVYEVLDSCMLMAKNVYNASLYLILNLHSSYSYNKETLSYHLKDNLHANQIEVIKFYKQAIIQYNQYKINKNKKSTLKSSRNNTETNNKNNIETNSKVKDLVLLAELNDSMLPNDFNHILLQATLLERVLKLKESHSTFKDYGKVYSSISQEALFQTIQDCKSWLQAMISFHQGNKSSTNASLPQRPRYKDKNERLTMELSARLFSKTGSLFKINPKKHTLYSDFNNPATTILNEDKIKQFNVLNLQALLQEQLNKHINNELTLNNKDKEEEELNTNYSIQTIRFVPHRETGKGLHQYNLKIEVVVKISHNLPESSTLTKALQFYESHKLNYINSKIKEINSNINISSTTNNNEINSKINVEATIEQHLEKLNNTKNSNFKTKEFWELKKTKQDKVFLDFIQYEENKVNLTNNNETNNIKSKNLINTSNGNSKNITNKLHFKITGVDLGVVNTATVVHSHAMLHQIYTGSFINQQLTKLNHKLDEFKTKTFASYIETIDKNLLVKLKYNQAIAQTNQLNYKNTNKDKTTNNSINNESKLEKLKLTIKELQLIGEANKIVYQNKTYSNLLIKLENLKNNHLHQLSSHIIQQCTKNKTQFLCIGKNEGWKQEVEMNKLNNRLFMSIAHDKLVDLLTYKALAQGILVITTEESYTSQASFMHSDYLPVYLNLNKVDKNKEEQLKHNESKLNKASEANLNHSELKTKSSKKEGKNKNHHDFSGIRNDRIYTFKQGKQLIFKGKTLIKIHADINGGLNIPRKVFKSYNHNSLMSLNYEVIGQSTKNNWKSNRNKNLNNLNNNGKFNKIIPAKYKPYFKVINSSHFNSSLQS